MLTRRALIEAAGAAAVAAFAAPAAAGPLGRAEERLEREEEPAAESGRRFCFFSKHLPDLDASDLASAVIDMGYDGIDLTVRPGGHVLPERVTDDLPRALDAIRAKGTTVAMITTGLVSASEPTARPILQAAGRAGIKLVKPGYWKYALKDVRAEVAGMARDVAGLATLAHEQGVELGVHNHAGYIGASIWDLAPHIDALDVRTVGYYFDPRHAVVEGGGVGWKTATLLVAPRLKMIAVKDFYWEKQPGPPTGAPSGVRRDGVGARSAAAGWEVHTWRAKSCPMGEGMVDWSWFAGTIVASKFAGPISVHFEYEIPGATKADVQRNTIAAGKRDLAFIRQRFAEAHA